MNERHTRVLRRLVMIAVAAVLAAPTVATAGGSGQQEEPVNPILRNDVASGTWELTMFQGGRG